MTSVIVVHGKTSQGRMSEQSEALEHRIGVAFGKREILTEALTHRSYLNEHPDWKGRHNERLEFLGDAVLELAVTQHLYEIYPKEPEGRLTNLRAALVRAETLAIVGAEIDLIPAMLLSKGEAKDKGRSRDQILANAMESLIGAIFLDKGYAEAEAFIQRFILTKLSDVIAAKKIKDAKSMFQEEAQSRVGLTPRYDVIKEWGPDHMRRFRIGAFLGDELIGEGEGESKQDAQQAAAKDALVKKHWES